ncbi:MAG: c-type cytochrome [Planctomycetota bacterium]|jgi:mono/diheme cytochrome c family protein
MRFLPILTMTALLAAWLAAADESVVARGKEIFHDTQRLEYPACAQCHSLVPEKDEAAKAKHLRPGATLYGAAVRGGWRNRNTYQDVGEASQLCAKWWQKRKGGLKPSQRVDLVAFLKRHSPKGRLPKRKVERQPKLLKSLDGGDAAKGAKLVARYCHGCHGEADDALAVELKPNRKKKLLIARKVRGYNSKNQFKPQAGSMSYYTSDRLSDADLLHIIAHLGK